MVKHGMKQGTNMTSNKLEESYQSQKVFALADIKKVYS